MLTHRVKIYIGPVYVNDVHKLALAAGYADALPGTEHLYVTLNDSEDGWGIMDALYEFEKKIGCTWRLRAEVLRSSQ